MLPRVPEDSLLSTLTGVGGEGKCLGRCGSQGASGFGGGGGGGRVREGRRLLDPTLLSRLCCIVVLPSNPPREGRLKQIES